MALSTALTFAFVAGEALAGYYSHSLALLSDAGHNFSDAAALLLSWYAVREAKRPAGAERTFGSHRVGILVALANAATLIAIALFIFWEALRRLHSPEPVESAPMIAVAIVAVLLNGLISLWLRGGAQHDLNVKSAYMHMLGDMVSAAGVIVAGIVVMLTGSPLADPIVSVLIGGFILWSSWGILGEATNILLEASPAGLNMASLEQSVKEVPGVLGIHDLHVWTIGSGLLACSCHIVVEEQSVRAGQSIIRSVGHLLKSSYKIAHTTVQVEVECCEPDEVYCKIAPIHEH